jgi:hypothetical protein
MTREGNLSSLQGSMPKKSNVSEKINSNLVYTLALLGVVILLYSKFFFGYNGQLNFGNFVFPSNINQFYNTSIFWNPYLYNGSITVNPEGEFFYEIALYSSYLIFHFLGSNSATKFIIILSTFLVALSLYLFLRELINVKFGAFIGALFYVLNPFFIQLIGSGDFYVFFYQSMIIFSYLFLVRWLRSNKYLSYSLLVSSILFTFATSLYELFGLGFLFAVFIFLFVMIADKRVLSLKLKLYSIKLLTFFVMLVTFSLPFILTTSINLGNLVGYSSPLNFNNYYTNSSTFINVLTLHNYFPNLGFSIVLNTFGHIVYYGWYITYLIMITSLLLAFVYVRKNKELLFLSSLILIIALIGSGAKSPVYFINNFLYVNVPLFRAFNASYYWTWFLILPMYSIILTMVIAVLVNKAPPEACHLHGSKIMRLRRTTIIKITIILVIAIILIIPAASQGYYGNYWLTGIRSQSVPDSYSEIMPDLTKIVNKSMTGVAFFNPSYYLTLNNYTYNDIINPAYTYTNVRIAGLPGYAVYPLQSNFYTYWLYSQFYGNETRNIAQLFGIMGVKYFVILNNTQPFYGSYFLNGSFASNPYKIMQYQENVKLMSASKNYSIYGTTYNVNEVSCISNYSLVSGTYNTLNGMANSGFNLTKMAIIYPQFLTESVYNSYLANASYIILPNFNSIFGLVEPLISKYSLNLSNLVSASMNSNWIPSFYYDDNIASTGVPYFFQFPYDLLVSSKGGTLKIHSDSYLPGNYTVIASFFQQKNVSGNIFLSLNGMRTTISTNSINANDPNGSLEWVSIPITLTSSEVNLTVTSVSGVNGIGSITIVPNSVITDSVYTLSHFISSHNIRILIFNNGKFYENNSLMRYIMPLGNMPNDLVAITGTTFNPSSIVNLKFGAVEIQDSASGFYLAGNLNTQLLVRIPFDSSWRTSENTIAIYPAFGGVDMIFKLSPNTYLVEVYPTSYIYTIYAALLVIFVVVSYIVVLETKVFLFLGRRQH